MIAANSDVPLTSKLEEEKNFTDELNGVMKALGELSIQNRDEERTSLDTQLKRLNDSTPKMLTTVWDNINIRANHRFERITDTYEDLNFDYTTSMHMTERISVDHMSNAGKAFKLPEELTLEDFVPNSDEKELLFCSMVPMYSHALLQRYPELFKSLKSSIKDHHPHQFQTEMSMKSEEFTGQIFDKSENKTEDLISMIEEYQRKMNLIAKADNNQSRIAYRRQLTGDQKTEKNTHYAILR